MSTEEILTLEPTTPISAVGNVEITVNEFRRLLSPMDQNSSIQSRFLNEEIIWAAITKLEPLPDHKHVLLPFLSKDLTDMSIDDTLARYVHEYELRIQGYDIIVIPLLYAKHWTLMVVYPDTKLIEYFDSFHNKQEPHKLFFTSKLFMDLLLESKFEVSYRKDIPSQFNNYDCGMYIIKFAEHAITGIPLNFSDDDMISFRFCLASKFRILPVTVDREFRDTDDTMLDDSDLRDEVDEDDETAGDLSNDVESSLSEAKPSQNRIDKVMEKCSMEKQKTFGIYSYQESLRWQNLTVRPFLGKDFHGKTVTYNTNGDWKRMLNFLEIMNYFNTDHKEAVKIIIEEIRKDPETAIGWNENSVASSDKLTPYNFRWFHRGNFLNIKKELSSIGINLKDYYLKKKNAIKKSKKKSKNKFNNR